MGGMTFFYAGVAGLGAAGLAATGWLVVLLRRDHILPARLVTDVPDKLRLGRRDEALALCRRDRSALARIWRAVLEAPADLVRRDARLPGLLLQGEAALQVAKAQARASYLIDLGHGALVVGLFAALAGAARVLGPFGGDSLAAPPAAVAEAIRAAVAASGVGLAIAMVAQAAYALFRTFGAPALDALEETSRSLLGVLPECNESNPSSDGNPA